MEFLFTSIGEKPTLQGGKHYFGTSFFAEKQFGHLHRAQQNCGIPVPMTYATKYIT
jgi:hypothetical protein